MPLPPLEYGPAFTAGERVLKMNKSLPTTLRQGIISVLYKKGERDDPRNYRPITLLNNDYKIMMRILTKRMNEAVLQFVI